MTTVRTNWLPSLFSDFFDDDFMGRRPRRVSVPAVNVLEDEKGYKIELAAPGMTKEDLHVSINEDNEIVIAFEKKSETCDDKNGEKCEKKNDRTYLRHEFSYNSFRQAFTLPEDVDLEKIDGQMKDGILYIDLPKKDLTKETPVSRQIEIK